MESGMIKTSAVLVGLAGRQVVYPSLGAVPEPLRRKVVECTSGRNSGTVVIADQRGRAQINRIARVTPGKPMPRHPVPASQVRLRRYFWLALASILTVGAGAGLLFLPH